MRWRSSRVGPQCERAEGREEGASRGRSRAHISLRSGLASTFLPSVEPSRTAQVGRHSAPTWTFSDVVLSGKARTKKDTQAGRTTSDLRGEKSCWTGESARKWSLLCSFRNSECVQEKKRRGAGKGGEKWSGESLKTASRPSEHGVSWTFVCSPTVSGSDLFRRQDAQEVKFSREDS